MPKSVLIADDEAHLRFYVKFILKDLGLTEFYEAANGVEAIDIYRDKKPDLVMLDINMPLKNGVEVLADIIGFDSDAVVIMLTSVASMDIVKQCVDKGGTFYIRKDTPRAVMIETLGRLLKDIYGDSREE